jgi:hypothetical protein
MNRRERRERERQLLKVIKKTGKNTFIQPETEDWFKEFEASTTMQKSKEELIEARNNKELKSTLNTFMDALTISKENPLPHITLQCIEKGPIVLTLGGSSKDKRCSNIQCITCRSYDVEEGLVDRHLLSDKEKQERDLKALEEQKLRDPEGYEKFLKSEKIENSIQDVDFIEIEKDGE